MLYSSRIPSVELKSKSRSAQLLTFDTLSVGASLATLTISESQATINRKDELRTGDTVTFAGEVTDKRREAGKAVAECRIKGTNQRGELVCLADATMVMSDDYTPSITTRSPSAPV